MLKLVYGARSLSLGGACVSLNDHIYYMDSNPAGGDTEDLWRISLLHQEWIADTNYESIRVSRGFDDRFYAGLGFTYMYIPFVHYDLYGSTDGNTYNISQSLGIINGGYRLREQGLTVGGNLKVYYYHVPEDLAQDQNYLLFAADVGVLKNTNILKRYVGPEPSLSFGLAVRNLGYSNVVKRLPMEVHAGASYRPMRNLLLTSQVCFPLFEPMYGAVGAEYDFDKKFYVQGGVQVKANPMFSVGAGYRREDLRIQVAYTPTIAFYNMISVSVSYDFGRTRRENHRSQVEELLQEAFEQFEQHEYEHTLELVDKVLTIDPGNRRAEALKELVENQQELEKQAGKVNGGSAR
jgi:hypothetical protein